MLNRARLVAASLVLVAGSSVALAQAPAMPAVEFPVDTSTIGPVVVAAGAAILILIYPIKLGFSFVKRLVKRMSSAV